jgi:hypothetical protein
MSELIKQFLHEALFNETLNKVSTHTAKQDNLFGPVYHGTDSDRHNLIQSDGFKIFIDSPRSGSVKHGYPPNPYYPMGPPPPIHHLGYGIYFTTVKAIAKKFNGDTTKNLKEFYLNVPRLETINFASPKKMMQWWVDNGYDLELAKSGEPGRIQATINLTDSLKAKYDAVLFTGRSVTGRLLDGNQICVFDTNNIYLKDDSEASGLMVGSKVILNNDILTPTNHYSADSSEPQRDVRVSINKGTKGVIIDIRDISPQHIEWVKNNSDFKITDKMSDAFVKYWKDSMLKKINGDGKYYKVKFAKGGTDSNISSLDITPIN